MKKLFLLLLCAALLVSLAACAKDKTPDEPASDETVETDGSKETDTPDGSDTSDNTPDDTPAAPGEEIDHDAPLPSGKPTEEVDILPQLDIIAANADMWLMDQYEGEVNLYAVTDLDGNGRLEIIAANEAGTGLYTWTSYYEVNEARDGIERLETDMPEGASQPDITVESTDCYLAGGVYYYIETDALRNGYAESYIFLSALSVENGAIKNRALATYAAFYGETAAGAIPEPEVTYTDADGKEITEQEFYDTDRHFPGADRLKAYFGWFEVAEEADLPALLRTSYDTFARVPATD